MRHVVVAVSPTPGRPVRALALLAALSLGVLSLAGCASGGEAAGSGSAVQSAAAPASPPETSPAPSSSVAAQAPGPDDGAEPTASAASPTQAAADAEPDALQRARPRLPDACPRWNSEVDLAACQQDRPADYGLSETQPAEWGMLAVGGSLWAGRLVCPGGAAPASTERLGSIGKTDYVSTAQPVLPDHTLDVVDKWQVDCPGQQKSYVIYTNMYRCGSPCPPPGFGLVPAEAIELLDMAMRQQQLGEHDAMVASLEQAMAAGRYESVFGKAAEIFAAAAMYDRALDAVDRALDVDPRDPEHRLRRASVLRELGRFDQAARIADDVLADLDAEAELRPWAICEQASALYQSGKRKRARRLARKACQAGWKGCC